MEYGYLIGVILIVFFVGSGLIGFYRALTYKTNLLTKWHAIVFFITTVFLCYAFFIANLLFSLAGLVSFFIAFPLWLFTAIELYNATEERPNKTLGIEYIKLIGALLAFSGIIFLLLYYADKSK